MAAGASLAGARCIVTMKHVGLNVAADPLMTLAYIGVEGGFVACVADDPGMHSSQNEQDTRNYARFAKMPIFEPSDSQEAKDFLKLALEISRAVQHPGDPAHHHPGQPLPQPGGRWASAALSGRRSASRRTRRASCPSRLGPARCA